MKIEKYNGYKYTRYILNILGMHFDFVLKNIKL